ncbi:hypothetical protein TREMEDRAFT_59206 [Tremella mesenterica DSM 1558]|uniref:uncharacterized protein n=1 Tax=Tremella mesenterica (strain ATCC 24925 / CBS 8224 / DSM 1558 / NBRC 9311 / NRRL Y-6157 / RJB 2259-6 / UBC 559-6) TaxID=578456 RepID=UPI0003F49714|nr:uncharacterized protein TREMEDRAFT_59206 [Tremella mesenterica DSM 1558]EIW73043.1 hypothetical protein TREMEDRAFT_59206 [Tremella mesenterica DSM 1558]
MPSARTWPSDKAPTFNEEFMTSTSSTGNWGTEDEPIEEQGMWGWIGDGVTRVASVARGMMGLSIGNGEDQNATPVRTGENITQGSDRKGSKRPAEEEFTNETETSRRKKRVSHGGGGYGTSRRSGR